jgi:hypothetical protein
MNKTIVACDPGVNGGFAIHTKDGILLFATNLRNFRLDHDELRGLRVKDLSRATLAFDCERGANRHHVFQIGQPAH